MSDRPPYRAVVADDVDYLRTLLRIVLESSGKFDVVAEARNGREAVDATVEHRPDLTLLDLSMPVMDGLEALPLIRQAVPSTSVVVLSGFDADRMEQTALAAGARAYLVKGISPEDLVSRLLAVLGDPEQPPVDDVSPEPETLQLSAGMDSPSRARQFVKSTLQRWRRTSHVDDVMLLTTELVSNAVVHARSAVTVRVYNLADHVRVEVTDYGGGALELKAPAADSLGGRGLLLVQELSRSWGTSADGHEKVVWFEV
ncbi:MAG TPA: response regulator [Egibacteraceae bacterium]|nr:response regulator [Egibacteraceae bacterium]